MSVVTIFSASYDEHDHDDAALSRALAAVR